MNTEQLLKIAVEKGVISGYATDFEHIEISATPLFFENGGQNTLFANKDALNKELGKVLNIII